MRNVPARSASTASRRAPVLLALLLVPLLLASAPAPGPDPAEPDAPVAAAVVTAARDALATVGCRSPYELDAVHGCVRQLGDGMVEYLAPDGTTGTTHGGDPVPSGTAGEGDAAADATHDHGTHEHATHDHAPTSERSPAPEPTTPEAAAGSRTLPGHRRPVVCAPAGTARAVVLYGHRGSDRRSSHLATIRATLERSNQAVAQSAQRSGGPLADLRVRCGSDGQVAVGSVEIGSTRFADLRATLRAAGYDRPDEKYLLFADADAPTAGVAGTADLFLDDRRREDNRNNGGVPMYAVVYGADEFAGPVALHELAHTMGAVQPDAPGSDGVAHCTEQLDVLCYPAPGASRCGTLAFDCGNDTYFSTATRPGEWLHEHWNLGWEGNRFIDVARATSSTSALEPGRFRDTVGHTHEDAIAEAVELGITTGYADGTFRPGRSVSRAQIASFLARGFALPPGDGTSFRDVGPGAHAGAIGAAVRAQLTSGYPDGTYRPASSVTRGQLATFLARALDLRPVRAHGFSDVAGSVHEEAIGAVAAAGVTNGYADGTFRPNQPVPRGQVAALLVRALAIR